MADQEAIDYVNRAIQAEVIQERERCAQLCELAGHLDCAAKIRWGDKPRKRKQVSKPVEEMAVRQGDGGGW